MSPAACPRCGAVLPDDQRIAALSRFNPAVRVCAGCGVEEAVIQWLHPADARAAVHPISGVRPWADTRAAARAAHPSGHHPRDPR